MFNNVNSTNNPNTGILCLSVILECVCESASACAFKGEVGPCACYGMS